MANDTDDDEIFARLEARLGLGRVRLKTFQDLRRDLEAARGNPSPVKQSAKGLLPEGEDAGAERTWGAPPWRRRPR